MPISKSFFAASLGTMIEYYDMVLYLIMLPLISPYLFGGSSSDNALTKGYLVLFVTALARPLGAVTFGTMGDFMGRPKALLTSMYGIAIATLVIGIIPSYQSIGVFTILILVLAKAIQTFCFGGEFSGAGIYVVEHAHPQKEIFNGSLLTAIAVSGSLLASLFGLLITYDFMPLWSWRLAFIFGGIVGLWGIQYRKKMLESPNFVKACAKDEGLFELIKQYPLELLTGTFIGGMATIAYTTVIAFINPFLLIHGYFSAHYLMILQTLLIAFSVLVLIGVGKLGNHYQANKIMQIGVVLFALIYPIVSLTGVKQLFWINLLSFLLIFLTELFFAPVNAYYKNLFPMQFRYRGASLSFCLGMSLLGGITPLIENYLYQYTQQFSSIFLWISLNAFLTWICLLAIKRKRVASNLDTNTGKVKFAQ